MHNGKHALGNSARTEDGLWYRTQIAVTRTRVADVNLAGWYPPPGLKMGKRHMQVAVRARVKATLQLDTSHSLPTLMIVLCIEAEVTE